MIIYHDVYLRHLRQVAAARMAAPSDAPSDAAATSDHTITCTFGVRHTDNEVICRYDGWKQVALLTVGHVAQTVMCGSLRDMRRLHGLVREALREPAIQVSGILRTGISKNMACSDATMRSCLLKVLESEAQNENIISLLILVFGVDEACRMISPNDIAFATVVKDTLVIFRSESGVVPLYVAMDGHGRLAASPTPYSLCTEFCTGMWVFPPGHSAIYELSSKTFTMQRASVEPVPELLAECGPLDFASARAAAVKALLHALPVPADRYDKPVIISNLDAGSCLLQALASERFTIHSYKTCLNESMLLDAVRRTVSFEPDVIHMYVKLASMNDRTRLSIIVGNDAPLPTVISKGVMPFMNRAFQHALARVPCDDSAPMSPVARLQYVCYQDPPLVDAVAMAEQVSLVEAANKEITEAVAKRAEQSISSHHLIRLIERFFPSVGVTAEEQYYQYLLLEHCRRFVDSDPSNIMLCRG